MQTCTAVCAQLCLHSAALHNIALTVLPHLLALGDDDPQYTHSSSERAYYPMRCGHISPLSDPTPRTPLLCNVACALRNMPTMHHLSTQPTCCAPHFATSLQVLLWDLESHSTSLAAARSSGSSSAAGAGTRLQALHRLEGHEETVEDVCWCPDSAVELASVGEPPCCCGGLAWVWTCAGPPLELCCKPDKRAASITPAAGDDYALLLWDTRAGSAPALSVPTAHGRQDVHSVAWSPHRQELLVTGGLVALFRHLQLSLLLCSVHLCSLPHWRLHRLRVATAAHPHAGFLPGLPAPCLVLHFAFLHICPHTPGL